VRIYREKRGFFCLEGILRFLRILGFLEFLGSFRIGGLLDLDLTLLVTPFLAKCER